MSNLNTIQLRRLDFSLLLVFDAAMETRKLSDVAARLGLTSSAISHALARLRDIFDDPLFERHHQGVHPTRRALELEPEIRSILTRMQSAISKPVFDPATLKRAFRIAALDYVMVVVGPALTHAVAEQARHVQLSFITLGRSESLAAVKRNEIDVAIGVYPTVADGIALRPLTQDHFVCVARENHPVLKNGLSMAAFTQLDHMLVSGSGELSSLMDDVLKRQGASRRVVTAVPQFLASLATVATSDVIASVPQRLASRYARKLGLETHALPFDMPQFEVTAATARSASSDVGLQWLLDLITSEFGQA
jgi:DNA-binding transcriptional LysR family regulator